MVACGVAAVALLAAAQGVFPVGGTIKEIKEKIKEKIEDKFDDFKEKINDKFDDLPDAIQVKIQQLIGEIKDNLPHPKGKFFPLCACDNYRNGATVPTGLLGKSVCAKTEAFSLFGDEKPTVVCQLPDHPFYPFVHNGCPSDMHRCINTYDTPRTPFCECEEYRCRSDMFRCLPPPPPAPP